MCVSWRPQDKLATHSSTLHAPQLGSAHWSVGYSSSTAHERWLKWKIWATMAGAIRCWCEWTFDVTSVVDADTLNTFKSRLGKHWLHQDVLYNFHSELTGTGSALICMWCCKRYGQRGIPAPVYSHWIWSDWCHICLSDPNLYLWCFINDPFGLPGS